MTSKSMPARIVEQHKLRRLRKRGTSALPFPDIGVPFLYCLGRVPHCIPHCRRAYSHSARGRPDRARAALLSRQIVRVRLQKGREQLLARQANIQEYPEEDYFFWIYSRRPRPRQVAHGQQLSKSKVNVWGALQVALTKGLSASTQQPPLPDFTKVYCRQHFGVRPAMASCNYASFHEETFVDRNGQASDSTHSDFSPGARLAGPNPHSRAGLRRLRPM